MSRMPGTVTREDVILCFRTIFHRELSDEVALQNFIDTEEYFRSLVNTLLSSTEYRENYGKIRPNVVDRVGFVYDDLISSQEKMLRVLRKVSPHDVKGHRKIRVGREGDGGYVMLDDFEGIEAAYALGINTDVTWDKDIAARGIDIFQYDHTIEALPDNDPRFHWFKCPSENKPLI